MKVYSKIQKSISSLLIFTTFYTFTFNISFNGLVEKIFADNSEFYNMVSIIVQEELYDNGLLSSDIKSSIETYAKNIQNTLPDTKVLIFPVPKETSPFNIASINEKLYFEGYKGLGSLSGDSRLLGTVFVGDIALPIVSKEGNVSKTILPYVDFENKLYVYNHENNTYEYNDLTSEPKVEIWHGFISPNTGDESEDVKLIKNYFKKNNDFYQEKNQFSDLNTKEPYVFYYDQIRETQYITDVGYAGYKSYLENREDIVYDRYTKKLLNNIKKYVDTAQDDYFEDLGEIDGMEQILSNMSTGDDIFKDLPDIQIKTLVSQFAKKYLEAFNKAGIGEFKEDVFSSGRYNGNEDNTNMDTIPYLLTILDETFGEILKSANSNLESEIDDLVENKGLARNIPILTSIERKNTGKYENIIYKNYIFGTAGEDITSLDEVDIFRGTIDDGTNNSQMVQSVKTFDLSNTGAIEQDVEELTKYIDLQIYSSKGTPKSWPIVPITSEDKLDGSYLYGNHTVLNLDNGTTELSDEIQQAKTIYEQNKKTYEQIKEMYEDQIREVEKEIDDLQKISNQITQSNETLKDEKELLSLLEADPYGCYIYEDNRSTCKTKNSAKIVSLKFSIGFLEKTIPVMGKYCEYQENAETGEDDEAILYGKIDSDFKYVYEDEDNSHYEPVTFPPKEYKDSGENKVALYDKCGNYQELESEDSSFTGYTVEILNSLIRGLEEEVDLINNDIKELTEINKQQQLIQNGNDGEKSLYQTYYPLSYSRFVKPIKSITGSQKLSYLGSNQILPLGMSFSNGVSFSIADILENNSIMLENYSYPRKTARYKIKTGRHSGSQRSNAIKQAFIQYVTCDRPAYEKPVNLRADSKKKKRGSKKYYYGRHTYDCKFISDSPLVGQPSIPSSLNFYYTKNFESGYKSSSYKMSLDGTLIKTNGSSGKLNYKSVLGVLKHKSPTDEEILAQENSKVTPNLPVDAVRYVDFMGAAGGYEKIIYPQLYDLLKNINSDDTLVVVKSKIKKVLDKKSKEINEIIKKNDISKLSTQEKKLYDLFKNVDLSINEINLFNYLLSQKSLNYNGKEISYIDMLAMAIYWNSLESIPQKYKFIIQNYLGDFYSSDKGYLVPGAKSVYEIGYFQVPGDSENMYIKLDPTELDENPYSQEEADKAELDAFKFAVSSPSSTNISDDSEKSCFPPEGAELKDWWPSVECRWNDIKEGYEDLKWKNILTKSPCSSYTIGEHSFCSSVGPNCNSESFENAVLDLNSDYNKAPYYTRVALTASLKSDLDNDTVISIKNGDDVVQEVKMPKGVTLRDINNLGVEFYLTKLEIPKDSTKSISNDNKLLIYDKNNQGYSSQEDLLNALKYIDFENGEANLNSGVAKYFVNTLNYEVNASFQASVTYQENTKISKNIDLEIRGENFFGVFYKLSEYNNNKTLSSGLKSVKANNEKNIILIDSESFNYDKGFLDKLKDLSDSAEEALFFNISTTSANGEIVETAYPLSYTFTNTEGVKSSGVISSRSDFYKGFSFTQAGTYLLEISDSDGRKIKSDFTILPAEVDDMKVEISNNLVEKGGVYLYGSLGLFDKYSNIVKGELYTVDGKISNKLTDFTSNLKFDNASDNITFDIINGAYNFRVKTTDSNGISKLTFTLRDNQKDIKVTKDIRVVDSIDVDFSVNSNQKFTVGSKEYPFEIKVKNVDDFVGNAYLSFDENYFSVENNSFSISNSLSNGIIKTTNKSVKSTNIKVFVDGKKDPVLLKTVVFPDKPMKLEVVKSGDNLPAKNGNRVELYVSLQDLYGNTIFIDSQTTVSLELNQASGNILKPLSTSKQLKNGFTTFSLETTSTPGKAYFLVKSNTDISKNRVVLTTSAGEKKEYFGSNSTPGSIETYYFWNKDEIQDNKYNTLYSTLLGGPYGDLTVKDNLANSLLFDKDNKSLAVTTFLSDPYEMSKIITISPKGNISFLNDIGDLSMDVGEEINLTTKGFEISLRNTRLNDKIAKLFVKPRDKVISVCGKNSVLNCDNSGFNLKILDGGYRLENGNFIDDYTNSVLFNNESIYSGNLSFKVNQNYSDNLVLNVYYGSEIIALLLVGLNDENVKVLNTESEYSTKKSLQLYMQGGNYISSKEYLDQSTGENYGYSIMYNDPLSTSEKTLDIFSEDFSYGYENYKENSGIGWKNNNKTLLLFSAGNSVGESTKQYQSFHTINLGDPVLELSKKQKNISGTSHKKSYDSSIGKLISNDEDNLSYVLLDYNNDNFIDIAVLKSTGFIQLFEGTGDVKSFVDRGNVVYFGDLGGDNTLLSGDFIGDGYDELVLLNKDREIILVNNSVKKFSRIDLSLDIGDLSQIEAKDMDKDGKTDLITLDNKGDLKIHYGTNTSGEFSTKTIANNGEIKLNTSTRNDMGLVYYDGLIQVDSNELYTEEDKQESKKYLETITAQIESDKEQMQVLEQNYKNTGTFDLSAVDLSTTGVTQEADFETVFNGEIFTTLQYIPESEEDYKEGQYITFIKSNYAHHTGLKVEKRFKNLTSTNGLMKADDTVNLEIILKNISSSTLNDIAYIEKIPEYFNLDTTGDYTLEYSGQEISKENIILKQTTAGYSFLMDSYSNGGESRSTFSLVPGGEIKLSLNLKVLPFSYGHIEIGDYDSTQQDLDILFKVSEENCGLEQTIYKSISSRTYTKDTQTPKTKGVNLNSPENKVKDFLESFDENNPSASADYLQELEQEMYNSIDQKDVTFDDHLNNFNQSIDDVITGIDNLAETFNCGNGASGCLSIPFNWAPLAPGGDPVLYGYPIGDGFHVNEGIPVFSAMTTALPTPFGPIPFIWPPIAGGGGGRLGGSAPYNFIRVFVTPTLSGAMGSAVCFGPNRAAGYIPPPGLSPLVPAGNCIVTTTKTKACKDDGSTGDVGSTAVLPTSDDPLVLLGNCTSSTKTDLFIPDDIAGDYLAFLEGDLSKKTSVYKYFSETNLDFYNYLKSKGFDPNTDDPEDYAVVDEPLIKLSDSNGNSGDLEIKVDLSSVSSGGFKDIVQISLKRVPSFPGVFMSWVEAQIEEIVTKLTHFPSIFITLPNWDEVMYGQNYDLEESETENVKTGISQVYDFISKAPLLDITEETIPVSIPWIDQAILDEKIISRKATISDREKEVGKYKKWYNETCIGGEEKTSNSISYGGKNCNVTFELINNLENLINKINKNIEVLESYKKIPEQIYSIISIKERLLDQILCNIEQLSETTSGWIARNGEIFKSWVETYILAKATIKSYQLMVDIFTDYQASCKECKNERGDAQQFMWSLISSVLPTFPIIQFPNLLPDIYIDFSKFKAGLDVSLPNFDMKPEPMLLPDLPTLALPTIGELSANVTLEINLEFEFDDLQEINLDDILVELEMPSLPSLNLPDLPEPPKLPKIPAQITKTLNILKLITKAMCLMKMLPFVPEWRVGDHIAYLTEAPGLRSFDFNSYVLPQFSYSYIQALRLDTYVNLNFDTDYIVELSRQLVAPFNMMVKDFSGILGVSLGKVDLSDFSIDDVNISADFELSGGYDFTTGESIGDKTFNFADKYNLTLNGDTFELNKENLDKIEEYYSNLLDEIDWSDYIDLDEDNIKKRIDDNFEKFAKTREDFHDTFSEENLEKIKAASAVDEIILFARLKKVKEEFSTYNVTFKGILNDIKEDQITKQSQEDFEELSEFIDLSLQELEEVEVDLGKEIEELNEEIRKLEGVMESESVSLNTDMTELFAEGLSKEIIAFYNELKTQGVKQYSNTELKEMIALELTNSDLYKEDGTSKIANLWNETLNYSFEKEEKIISDLEKNNKEKFENYKKIVEFEKQKLLEEKTNFEKLLNAKTLLVADNSNSLENIGFEDDKSELLKSYSNLRTPDFNQAKLKQDGEQLTARIKTKIDESGVKLASSNSSDLQSQLSRFSELSDDVEYTYKGVYVLEKDSSGKNHSYRLYDYLEEFEGNEQVEYGDVDLDGDRDIFYMAGTEIYLKENLEKNNTRTHYSGNPKVISWNNNPFKEYGKTFINAVNNFNSGVNDSGFINVMFNAGTDNSVNSYRLEFYDIVDKFGDIFSGGNSGYLPANIPAYIVDAFAQIEELSIKDRAEGLHIFSNNAYFTGNNLGGIQIVTSEMVDLKNGNDGNIQAVIKSGTRIYTGNKAVTIEYDENGQHKEWVLTQYKNMYFDKDVTIKKINNPLYIKGNKILTYSNPDEIKQLSNLPLFEGTKIFRTDDNSSSKVLIHYHNGAENMLDFSKVKYYEIMDLGNSSNNYLIRTNIENDFYYARLKPFSKDGIYSSYTNQILLSPQKESDDIAPEIGVFTGIIAPVYQEKQIDITDYILENSGVSGIKDIYIDFDLETDSSGDGDTQNDRDYYLGQANNKINIEINPAKKIIINVGKFEKLYNKKVKLYVVDDNDNVGSGEVKFEIYSPVPTIRDIENGGVIGELDESLKDEPVAIYRLRGGNLEKLSTGDGSNTVETYTNGGFKFNVNSDDDGLKLKDEDGDLIAEINEWGKVELNKTIFPPNIKKIDVYKSNDITHNESVYPKIVLKSLSGEELYYHYIITPDIGKVEIVDTFDGINSAGIYYDHINEDYRYEQIPVNVDYNAGDMVLVKNNQIIGTIFKDGRINLNSGYELEYSDYEDYVVFEIKAGNDLIGKVLLIPEKNYIME